MNEETQDFGTEYSSIRGKQKAFTREIDTVLRRIIKTEKVDVVNVESRTKSVKSFIEKCSRDDKSYLDPIKEITDLTGCRIICYYASDIEKISSLIEKNFAVDNENSIDRLLIENPNQFGYKSKHLVF